MTPLITVFTPTYNRVEYLKRIYDSLCRQSDKRFVWLVVDDGSTDNTREAVKAFSDNENDFEIGYIQKDNGGLHTAYNVALSVAETMLFMCIDSDDYLTDNGIHDILSRLEMISDESVAGFVAPNASPNGALIGGQLPRVATVHIGELKYKYRHSGDVKMIYKTDVLKKYAPMPVFDGEKVFNPCYMFLKADERYCLSVLETPVCVVDYSSNGMHTEVFHAYMNSPKSYAELRRAFMHNPYYPFRAKLRNAVHYVSSCIFAHEKGMLKSSPCPLPTLLAIPFGVALNLYVRLKNKGQKL